jgi:hypothetical protein
MNVSKDEIRDRPHISILYTSTIKINNNNNSSQTRYFMCYNVIIIIIIIIIIYAYVDFLHILRQGNNINNYVSSTNSQSCSVSVSYTGNMHTTWVAGSRKPSIFLFPMARQPLGGLGRLIFQGFTITHFLDTPHSVGLLWTSDQLVAETST